MREHLRSALAVARLCLRADPWRVIGAAVCTIGAPTLSPLAAIFIGRMTNAIVARDRHAAIMAAAGFAGMGLLFEVLGLSSFRLRMQVREKVQFAIDAELVDLICGIPGLEHLERPDHADKVMLLRNGRWQLVTLYDSLINTVSVVFAMVSTSIVLARVSPWLLVVAVFGLPALATRAKTAKAQEALSERTTEPLRVQGNLVKVAIDPDAAGEVRVFGLSGPLRRRHRELWKEVDVQVRQVTMRNQLLDSAAWLLFAVGYLGAIGLMASRAVRGQASAGEVAITASLAGTMRDAIVRTVHVVNWLVLGIKATERYGWLAAHAKAAAAAAVPAHPAPIPARLDHGITLDGVGFTYPGTDVDVLRDVSVHLPAGSTVAIVGDNGAGKSTLVKLLARFYEPTTGTITVDGVQLRDLPIDAWRERTSAGFQSFARPFFSARHAVGIGSLPHLDDDPHIGGALERGSAEAVIDDLPDGLDTQLGTQWNKGVELSGGQWQKLALGRAMMRDDPLLLLLDEPTAALDARTEHELFERYAGAARRSATTNGAITILVSHRFSTVRMADLILVVHDATVTEVGSHAELIARGGLYAELYDLQAKQYR
jgi:ATP-binding cassette subfamily B protein